MTRWCSMAIVVAAMVFGVADHGPLAAADRPSLAGRWTLNRDASQLPREVGFGMNIVPTAGSGSNDRGDAGSRGAGASAFVARRESEDDVRKTQQLVEEVRNPSPHLTIAQTETTVTITDERGRSRTFHPDGKEELQPLDPAPVATTTRWDGDHLVVRYKVEQDRELRYTYSRRGNPPQVVVQVQFVERGGHDMVTLVYEPTRADEPSSPDRASPADVARKPIVGVTSAASGYESGKAAVPASPGAGRTAVPSSPDRVMSPVLVQRPDGELTGLTALGLVVEELSPQAAACGLRQDAIEAAVSKSLVDAGLKVLRNTDEDTYVYVNVMTTSASTGLCVSRYDAFLYTNTTAKLSYQGTPVLVQVSLFHKGGIAGGTAGVHGDTVVRNVKQYVDEFAARIRNANRNGPG
ncbi:MAG: hypothetical protein IMZ65_02770 [Planctomycetes bacterium]|nr:hypothetical protein [Planctomycetota bacterium]